MIDRSIRHVKSSPPIDPPRSRESSPKVEISAPFSLLRVPSGPFSPPHVPSASFRPLQHTSPFKSLQPHSGPFSPAQVPSPTLRPLRPLCRVVSRGFGAPGTTRPMNHRRIDPRDTEHNKPARLHITHSSRASRAPFFPRGFSDTFREHLGPFQVHITGPFEVIRGPGVFLCS